MSAFCTAAVWEMDLPANDKIVLLKLADVADDDGQSIYMAQDTIAKQCGCSVRTVKRIFKKYTDSGLLKMVSPAGSKHKAATWKIMVTESHVPQSHVPESHPILLEEDSKILLEDSIETPRGVNLDSYSNLGDSFTTLQLAKLAFDEYCLLANELNLVLPRSLTGERKRKIEKRIKDQCEGNIEGWRDALDAIRRSNFLQGRNDSTWNVTLDWLIKSSTNFQKVTEGNYDDTTADGDNGAARLRRKQIYDALAEGMENRGTATGSSQP